MNDETTAAPRLTGADYRVKAQHPRRDGPLIVTAADGRVIGVAGETCDACSQEELASMLANGYIERLDEAPIANPPASAIPPVPARPHRRTTDEDREP